MHSRDLVMELIDLALDAAKTRLDSAPQGTVSNQDALTILMSQTTQSKDKLTHEELRDTCMEMLFSSVEGMILQWPATRIVSGLLHIIKANDEL